MSFFAIHWNNASRQRNERLQRNAERPCWSLLFVLLMGCVVLSSQGCRNNSSYGSCANRIPPPGTGSYTIPNGVARAASEPYYTRPEGTGVATPASSSAPTGSVTPAGGQWQPATLPPRASLAPQESAPLVTNLSSTNRTTDASSTALMWRSVGSVSSPEPSSVRSDAGVQPASFTTPAATSSVPGPAPITGLLPIASTPVPTSPYAEESQVATDEPNRLPTTQATLLPTEAGTIGSGVRSQGSPTESGSANAGRLSVDDLLGAPQASWRPKL